MVHVGVQKKEELEIFTHRLEEAEKRDHRKLGEEMDISFLERKSGLSVLA